MNVTTHSSVARLSHAFGVAVGAWLILSASTLGAQTFSSTAVATAAAIPDRIHLAQAAAAPADRPVSYSPEQVDRGKKIYDRECEDCHGGDLRGGMNGGPPLRGLSFEHKFADGAPASAMYMFMFSMMPPNDPGRYSESEYADLMAYILNMNGFQEGGGALPSDVDALDHVIVEK